jgi:hypothetical protein
MMPAGLGLPGACVGREPVPAKMAMVVLLVLVVLEIYTGPVRSRTPGLWMDDESLVATSVCSHTPSLGQGK